MTKKSKLGTALSAAICVVAIAACGQTAGAGGVAAVLERLKPLAANCHGQINAYDSIDGSTTGRGDATLIEQRLDGVDHLADQVAACGGAMKVVLFGGRSEAEGATLGEAEFQTSSGTETARLIAADKAKEALLAEVREALPAAFKEVSPNGTSVISQLGLARQYAEQHPSGRLYVQIETDGVQTVKPVVMNTPAFTKATARMAAERVALPDLSGADVQIVGIGLTSGARRPSTERVEAMTTFYEVSCDRSGASRCLITTDYSTGS